MRVFGGGQEFWQRSNRGSDRFRDTIDSQGPAMLLQQCRAAIGEKDESIAARLAKTERRQQQHLQDVQRLRRSSGSHAT